MRQANVPRTSWIVGNATDATAARVHAILGTTGIVHNFAIMQVPARVGVHIRSIVDNSTGTVQDWVLGWKQYIERKEQIKSSVK